jgi:ergothioneine biosynthesis protein EgtB
MAVEISARSQAEDPLIERYHSVRSRSLGICALLEVEDYQIQPMDDASPPKWHLAHTTWFFETFLLKPYVTGYQPFDEAYEYLFNSYYNGVGSQFPRARRGNLSRPTVARVKDYRAYVDQQMVKLLLSDIPEAARFSVILGLHHEEQHQELMFTDLKYNFGNNPLRPAYQERQNDQGLPESPLGYISVQGGNYEIGTDTPSSDRFVFDNESPRHTVFVGEYSIANRLTTNGEFLDFVQDGGYQNSDLWLSDAWSLISSDDGFRKPLYWFHKDGTWFEYTLAGVCELDLASPVVHVSGYEADAFARWSGARLPTEAEWEVAVAKVGAAVSSGNFLESGRLHASPAGDSNQFFGDAWEWTSSSYGPYPGFNTFPGQLGEYNGKFMANQLVLRGGSCVTSSSHIRATYRNFFYPKDRWQFSGIRLAKD